jgi:hypothetical protein
MALQKVHVVINKKTGKLSIEGDGFKGNECDVLEQVERQLGLITNIEDKPEKHQYIQPDYVPNTLN